MYLPLSSCPGVESPLSGHLASTAEPEGQVSGAITAQQSFQLATTVPVIARCGPEEIEDLHLPSGSRPGMVKLIRVGTNSDVWGTVRSMHRVGKADWLASLRLVAVLAAALAVVELPTEEPDSLPRYNPLATANFDVPSKLPRQPAGSVAVTSAPTDLRAPQLYFGADGATYPGTAAGAPVMVAGDGAQINFENADIRDFLKAVLADTLRTSYTVDPKVQGTATVASSAPLSRQDLLATVETVLRMNGAAHDR